MNGCGVYMAENPIGQVYIGASVNLKLRYASYNNGACYTRRPMDKSIRKFGKKRHRFTVLENCSREELIEKETFYIHYFKSLGLPLLNIIKNTSRKTKFHSMKGKQIALEVVRVRKEQGHTQRKLAKELGIALSTIKNFEEHGNINFLQLIKILSYYGLTVEVIQKSV